MGCVNNRDAVLKLRLRVSFDGSGLRMFWPILPYTFIVAGVAVLTTALFFFGPATITQATGLPLQRALENAVGSVPAFLLRICAIFFLVLWMAESIATAAYLWVQFTWGRNFEPPPGRSRRRRCVETRCRNPAHQPNKKSEWYSTRSMKDVSFGSDNPMSFRSAIPCPR